MKTEKEIEKKIVDLRKEMAVAQEMKHIYTEGNLLNQIKALEWVLEIKK